MESHLGCLSVRLLHACRLRHDILVGELGDLGRRHRCLLVDLVATHRRANRTESRLDIAWRSGLVLLLLTIV